MDGTLPVTPSWQAVNSGLSVAQYAIGAINTGYTSNNGIVVDTGYFFGKIDSTTNLSNIFSSLVVQINSNVRNIADVLVLTVTNLSSGSGSQANIYGTLAWQELY